MFVYPGTDLMFPFLEFSNNNCSVFWESLQINIANESAGHLENVFEQFG